MATSQYPDIKQCEGTVRQEVTTTLSETTDSGKVRGRIMYETPTYLINLVHLAVSKADYDAYMAWWADMLDPAQDRGKEIQVTLKQDGLLYQGLAQSSPQAVPVPYNRFDITFSLLGRQV